MEQETEQQLPGAGGGEKNWQQRSMGEFCRMKELLYNLIVVVVTK